VAIVNPARESFLAGHTGAAGGERPIAVTLFTGSTDRKLIVQAARVQIDATTAAAICADPAGHYVNYQTTDFPGGGQDAGSSPAGGSRVDATSPAGTRAAKRS
jgi:hypothetical protein